MAGAAGAELDAAGAGGPCARHACAQSHLARGGGVAARRGSRTSTASPGCAALVGHGLRLAGAGAGERATAGHERRCGNDCAPGGYAREAGQWRTNTARARSKSGPHALHTCRPCSRLLLGCNPGYSGPALASIRRDDAKAAPRGLRRQHIEKLANEDEAPSLSCPGDQQPGRTCTPASSSSSTSGHGCRTTGQLLCHEWQHAAHQGSFRRVSFIYEY